MSSLTPRHWMNDEGFDTLLDRFFGRAEGGYGASWPSLETFREGERLGVRVDLPGVDASDVEVSLHGRALTIRGERKARRENSGYREVRYGHFERTVAVPEGIDPESVEARYVSGVLEVTMPVPKGLVPRKVPVAVEGKTQTQARFDTGKSDQHAA